MQIVSKNTGDSLTADEFNQLSFELQNLIEDSGINLSSSVLTQLAKSVVNHVSLADFYDDQGSADAYLLEPRSNFEGISQLRQGARVRFLPNNSNTGASTANVNNIGTKDIKKFDGSLFIDLVTGDLVVNRLAQIYYNQTNDFWVLDVDETADTAQNNFNATSAPTANDDNTNGYEVGSRWIDVNADKAYECVDASTGAAKWPESSYNRATQSEAEAGTNNTKLMSPLRTSQAIDAQVPDIFAESSEVTYSGANTNYTTSHGLSVTPKIFRCVFRNKNGAGGYSPGDEVSLDGHGYGENNNFGTTLFANDSVVGIAVDNYIRIVNKDGSGFTDYGGSTSDWVLVFYYSNF